MALTDEGASVAQGTDGFRVSGFQSFKSTVPGFQTARLEESWLAGTTKFREAEARLQDRVKAQGTVHRAQDQNANV